MLLQKLKNHKYIMEYSGKSSIELSSKHANRNDLQKVEMYVWTRIYSLRPNLRVH